MPADLAAALAAEPKARAMFERLNSRNGYAVRYRVTTAKRAETRARPLKEYLGMLARGETVDPRKEQRLGAGMALS